MDDVELAGEYPTTVLVISFHRAGRPECHFAWHTFLWTVSPDAPAGPIAVADNWTDFLEHLGGIGPKLNSLPCMPEPYPLGGVEAQLAAAG